MARWEWSVVPLMSKAAHLREEGTDSVFVQACSHAYENLAPRHGGHGQVVHVFSDVIHEVTLSDSRPTGDKHIVTGEDGIECGLLFVVQSHHLLIPLAPGVFNPRLNSK